MPNSNHPIYDSKRDRGKTYRAGDKMYFGSILREAFFDAKTKKLLWRKVKSGPTRAVDVHTRPLPMR